MESQPQEPLAGDLRGRLAEIERAVDDGTYRPGPWQALMRDIRNSMFFERAALAEDVSRVSRKLHLRRRRRRVAMNIGFLLEIAAIMLGSLLVMMGAVTRSNSVAFLGALFWMVAFEPIIKLMVGILMGIHYDYFYLLAIEPRLKMSYGSYLANPPPGANNRSPLGHSRLAVGRVSDVLDAAANAVRRGGAVPRRILVLVIINVVNFMAPLLGIHRFGPMRLTMSSAGSAALEIREGLGW